MAHMLMLDGSHKELTAVVNLTTSYTLLLAAVRYQLLLLCTAVVAHTSEVSSLLLLMPMSEAVL
jgi:hypothetical protein